MEERLRNVFKNKNDWFENLFNGLSENTRKQMRKELERMDYDFPEGKTRISEGFGEYLRHFMTNDNVSEAFAPAFNQHFWESLNANPALKDVAEALNSVKQDYDTWLAQGLLEINTSKVAMKPNERGIKDTYQTYKEKAIDNWIDEMRILRDIEDDIGVSINDGTLLPTESISMAAQNLKMTEGNITESYVMRNQIDLYGEIS